MTGSFYKTPQTASFGVDALFGRVDGVDAEDNKQFVLDYDYYGSLGTSFVGDAYLGLGIDFSGSNGTTTMGQYLGVSTTDEIIGLDRLNLKSTSGAAIIYLSNNGEIHDLINGNCDYKSYTAFISYLDNWNCNLIRGVGMGIKYNFGESYGFSVDYKADSWGVAVSYVVDDYAATDDTTTWGINGYYSFDTASISVGSATTGLYASTDTEKLIYEASYSYRVNDDMIITPGVFIKETASADYDITGIAVKTSF